MSPRCVFVILKPLFPSFAKLVTNIAARATMPITLIEKVQVPKRLFVYIDGRPSWSIWLHQQDRGRQQSTSPRAASAAQAVNKLKTRKSGTLQNHKLSAPSRLYQQIETRPHTTSIETCGHEHPIAVLRDLSRTEKRIIRTTVLQSPGDESHRECPLDHQRGRRFSYSPFGTGN